MFLATTADQRFWKMDEKILFLGEWCRTFDLKSVWSDLEYEVLPYHWESRERYYQDFQSMDKLYERVLPFMVEKMNDFHKEDHSSRYWRIIIGPWLYYFIQIFYDRYLSLRHAIDSGKASVTFIPAWLDSDCTPIDFLAFQQWQSRDEYNLHLYSWIIKELEGVPVEVKNSHTLFLERPNLKRIDLIDQVKQRIKMMVELYSRVIPDKMKNIVMASLYIDHIDVVRLQISLGQLPNPCTPYLVPEPIESDFELRERFGFFSGENEFESLLSKIIFKQIPVAYLESYSQLKARAKKIFPEKAKVIISANAHFGNEGFKIWCAEQVEKGAKFIGTQHGGHYGNALWSSNEIHEIKVADRYFSWGWGDDTMSNVTDLSSMQLAGTQSRIQVDSQGGILWLGMSRPRYSNWMFSAPVGSQVLEYVEEQKVFLNNLNEEVRQLLSMRLFHTDYGWKVRDRLIDSIVDLNFSDEDETMYQQLCQSRLCIGTYNSTTNLETMSANFPTMAFWNFDHWKLRESARPYFEELCEVGVFHDNPISAAKKINEIYYDPLLWWNSPEVQGAVKNFCNQFARISKSWLLEWKNEINRIASE